MPIFTKPKNPKELIQIINDCLISLDNSSKHEKDKRKSIEEIARALNALREHLIDRSDSRVSGKEKDIEKSRIFEVISDITQEIISLDMFPLLLANLDIIDFESCKQVVELFGHILRKPARNFNSMVQYLLSNQNILETLLHGYDKPDCAIHYGALLRDACRNEEINKVVLGSPGFYSLFKHVEGTAFDVSSDAFCTLKDLLITHKVEVAEFLIANYDEFFSHYLTMLTSENYVTKRQALKLLGELLLDRANSEVMNRYVSDPENLKLIMNLLKSKAKQIAFESFHCFKVFVAKPSKPRAIHMILYQNQEKLLTFLSSFQTERTEDAQFNDERQYLIKQIRDLKAPPALSSGPSHSFLGPTSPQPVSK